MHANHQQNPAYESSVIINPISYCLNYSTSSPSVLILSWQRRRVGEEISRKGNGEVFRIGTVRYNWPMSAHASQSFTIAHCTDSKDLPGNVPWRIFWELPGEFSDTALISDTRTQSGLIGYTITSARWAKNTRVINDNCVSHFSEQWRYFLQQSNTHYFNCLRHAF